MARAFSLSAVLALRNGRKAALPAPSLPPRPPGRLIWVHVPDPARIGRIAGLAQQMAEEGDRTPFLVTSADIPAGMGALPRLTACPAPAETKAAAAAFLDHMKPDLLIWSEGPLRPVLLAETAGRGVPRLLVEAGPMAATLTGGRWIPGLTRQILMLFDHVLAVTADDAVRLQRAGLPPERIETTGPLNLPPPLPPHNERDRSDLASALGARPLWLAVGVTPAHLDEVILAHQVASRSAHRLLLILATREARDGPAIAAALRAAGLEVASRDTGEEPGLSTQVYLAEGLSEPGLWYRLSPITFLADSLAGGSGAALHPYGPAALGSAVLHGPATEAHAEAYARLQRAGAARAVTSGATLGAAVDSLLAPDRAAAMAHAAWDVTTEGVAVASRIASLARSALTPEGAA